MKRTKEGSIGRVYKRKEERGEGETRNWPKLVSHMTSPVPVPTSNTTCKCT